MPDLHDYAFDCVTHHLFHPYGSDSLRDEKDEEVMKQVTFDDSLQSESQPLKLQPSTSTF